MKIITKLPKFMPGQVIDLSYKHKGLPNRILIKCAFVREQDDQWMYECFIENIGEISILNENFIVGNATNRGLPVYKCADVIKLYNDGWRYCGNIAKDKAVEHASKCATNGYIKDIILRPAIDGRGCLVNDAYGMWIRYNNIINDDGTIVKNEPTNRDVIVIK